MRSLVATCITTAVLALALVASPAEGCTGIRLTADDGAVVCARTLEFGQDLESSVLFLPRDYVFTGTTASGKPGLAWKSVYSAVGLNAAGLDQLAEGVNEQGLGAGLFYMPGYAQYQEVNEEDEVRALAPYEVVTWILTSFATTDEVREAIQGIKVGAVPLESWKMVPPVHFIVHDKSGKSLVIEYTDGQLHEFDNPIGVITNAPTFDWHLTNLRNYVNLTATNVPPIAIDGLQMAEFGQGSGMRGLPGDFTPPSRFVRAVALSQSAMPGKTGPDAIKTAFHVLDSFDIPLGVVRPAEGEDAPREYTQWTSASDLTNGKFYFHTYGNRRTYVVTLKQFDAQSKQPITLPFPNEDPFEELVIPTSPN